MIRNKINQYVNAENSHEKEKVLNSFNNKDLEMLIEEFKSIERQNLLLFGRLNILEGEIKKSSKHLLEVVNEKID